MAITTEGRIAIGIVAKIQESVDHLSAYFGEDDEMQIRLADVTDALGAVESRIVEAGVE